MFNQLQITSLQVRNIQAKETTIEPYLHHTFLVKSSDGKTKILDIVLCLVHFNKHPERNREMLCDNAAKYY